MEDNTTGWVKLYHSSGAQITVPLSLASPITPAQANALIQSVTTLIAAGLAVSPENLEAGEQIQDIGALVRRFKVEEDGAETPVIDMYFPRGKHRWVAKYINTPEDIKEFEAATGLKLADLPVYDGNPIELGKRPKIDEQYVVSLKSPVKVVWKPNPRWDGAEDKKNPKRLFVRWASVAPTNGSTKPAAASSGNGTQPRADTGNGDLEQAYSVVIPQGIKIPDVLIGKTLGDAIKDPHLGPAVLLYLSGQGTNNAKEAFEPENEEQEAVKQAAEIIYKYNPVSLPKRPKK